MNHPNYFPTDDGLCVLMLGNSDIDRTERSPMQQRDETGCTLPIYPQPGDLPVLVIER